MKYELYHDESKQGGFWHGILLVPKEGKDIVLNYLEDIRKNSGYQHKIELKKVKKESKLFHISESWIHIGIAALISRRDAFPYPLPLPKKSKGKKEFKKIYEFVGAKFIVFREKDNLIKMSNCLDYGGKVETTLRMGLKGGLHFLGNDDEPICIEKMHFDGHEHYRRNIDRNRIVDRLKGLRSYCSITDNIDLIDDRTSNHEKANSQNYDDCQLLQLTDLLIGCFRTVLGEKTNYLHEKVAYPVKEVVKRYYQGYARMKNSRWFNSFCISECFLDSQGWNFQEIEYRDNRSDAQLNLFSPEF